MAEIATANQVDIVEEDKTGLMQNSSADLENSATAY